VHDRRIDGETQIFGNAGALFMNAMTWFDHATESIWSQPWGRAIQGEMKGVQLHLLPSQVTTWAAWNAEHPETLVMTNDVDRVSFRQGFSEDFVIGLLLDGYSKAYYYSDVQDVVVVNDMLGDIPVVIWAAENNFHAFVRQVGDMVLTFDPENGGLKDRETGTMWNVALGIGMAGPLEGEFLLQVPSTSSYDWAWSDFYPQAEFYSPEG
jgi:hypothetical protein